jgi:hypothetical protein
MAHIQLPEGTPSILGPNDYREMGQIMAHVGYVRPDWEKTGEAA